MTRIDLNLSTQPFKPYRAINLGLFTLLLVFVAFSVWQVYNYRQYSELANSIREEERLLRTEDETLAARTREMNALLGRGDVKAKLAEVDFLNQLIIRKTFSWTKVFATLEGLLPAGVHLTSLRPLVDENGAIILSIAVRGRTPAEAYQFINILEESQQFDNVHVPVEQVKDQVSSAGEVELSVDAHYLGDQGE